MGKIFKIYNYDVSRPAWSLAGQVLNSFSGQALTELYLYFLNIYSLLIENTVALYNICFICSIFKNIPPPMLLNRRPFNRNIIFPFR